MESRIPRQAIADADMLLRRVYAEGDNYFREDGTATPLAFRLRKDKGESGLSVDVERLTTLERAKKATTDPGKYCLCRLATAHVRSLALCVCHDPHPAEDPENGAHAQIIPFPDRFDGCLDMTGSDKQPPVMLGNSVRDRLAKGALKT
ncbi:MAG: hypothetical protein IPI41_04030 [Flavobacteriales bacterium]|nr:hypothetical protein [Flavobacteriales bacterium]